ncbi:tRNA pseudouridine(55) synthase TruB [Hymenobacter sp. BT18]|uniref:tRNA pseudouridine(55) synthase TruB n=1 Tax=Hymenobacter sp. BT18 TaxID=2835648 RepID=UPI00143EA88E|nr:tRNA pseudouridine(55) synthase TruB [Hymenobacter sp. BT18]QIX60651.1 tRNA pseudouridine(55) synthase TruB [Hymenobacter sp. BT18]
MSPEEKDPTAQQPAALPAPELAHNQASAELLAAWNSDEGGVLLLNKPLTWTSFDVVRKVKNTLRIKKIGHAGTLDPLATGLLILCTGKKTKQIDLIQAQEKEYTGTFRLGQTTPSFDLETPVDAELPYEHLTEEQVRAATAQFIGLIEQTPPLFSAVKVNGERAYEVARRGGEAEIKSKQVTIRAFELTRIELPEVDFRVTCSKGTYIRSLARDFGLALGCGAHLTKLVRTRIGEYAVADALSMAQLEALRPPRPEGEGEQRPRRQRQPERRAGLEYYSATTQADKPATPDPLAAAE